ncbi:MAG: hypothetical protein ACFE9L_07915 [Candidatus Hodarchaeota archaeon]
MSLTKKPLNEGKILINPLFIKLGLHKLKIQISFYLIVIFCFGFSFSYFEVPTRSVFFNLIFFIIPWGLITLLLSLISKYFLLGLHNIICIDDDKIQTKKIKNKPNVSNLFKDESSFLEFKEQVKSKIFPKWVSPLSVMISFFLISLTIIGRLSGTFDVLFQVSLYGNDQKIPIYFFDLLYVITYSIYWFWAFYLISGSFSLICHLFLMAYYALDFTNDPNLILNVAKPVIDEKTIAIHDIFEIQNLITIEKTKVTFYKKIHRPISAFFLRINIAGFFMILLLIIILARGAGLLIDGGNLNLNPFITFLLIYVPLIYLILNLFLLYPQLRMVLFIKSFKKELLAKLDRIVTKKETELFSIIQQKNQIKRRDAIVKDLSIIEAIKKEITPVSSIPYHFRYFLTLTTTSLFPIIALILDIFNLIDIINFIRSALS